MNNSINFIIIFFFLSKQKPQKTDSHSEFYLVKIRE